MIEELIRDIAYGAADNDLERVKRAVQMMKNTQFVDHVMAGERIQKRDRGLLPPFGSPLKVDPLIAIAAHNKAARGY